MNFYCAGNWKMNKNPEQALAFAKDISAQTDAGEQAQLVVLPPALIAYQVVAGLKGSAIRWGVQNTYLEEKGAFTGENSPAVAREMGARFALVGHSERRHVFGESDELIAKKVAASQKFGVTPILCVGETLEDRRGGRTEAVIQRQLRTALAAASMASRPAEAGADDLPLWVAYEPVWAIGTGEVASPQQVEEAHAFIRKLLQEWNATIGAQVPLLYGGSVKSDNARTLAGIKDVNGFLIGGASLDVAEFLKILRASNEIRKI